VAEFRVVTSLPHTLATIVAGALQAEGFTVRLDRPALSSVYGLDSGMFATRVLVPELELEAARRLIAEIEAAEDWG
jgi:hypothetical protein